MDMLRTLALNHHLQRITAHADADRAQHPGHLHPHQPRPTRRQKANVMRSCSSKACAMPGSLLRSRQVGTHFS